jgi:hypothetical protein
MMKKVLYYPLFALFFALSACANLKMRLHPPPVYNIQTESEYRCDLTNQYSVEQRRNMFPFNKAETVLFIAYENHQLYSSKTKTVTDTIYDTPDGKPFITERRIDATYNPCAEQKMLKKWSLTYENGKQTSYCAIESIKLNQVQIDSLSNILLNYKVTASGINSVNIAGCYTPRNTIIFLDKAENPIGFIEICFECHQMYGSNSALEEIAWLSLCPEKLSKIKNLFGQVGIHFGVDAKH